MALIYTDELNVIPSEDKKGRAIPFRQYFEEMELSEKQIDDRVNAAELFNEVFLFLFSLITMYGDDAKDNIAFILEQATTRFKLSVERVVPIDDYLTEYIEKQSRNIIDATMSHPDDEWYLSSDRAAWDAENTANDVCNYGDYEDAIASGMTQKTWVAFIDKKTREHHRQINGKTIGIYDYFQVGNAYMRFPKDYDMASDYPEELVNCRCAMSYS